MFATDSPLAFFAPEDPHVRPNNGVGKKAQDWLPCTTRSHMLDMDCTGTSIPTRYLDIHHIRVVVPAHTLVVAAARYEKRAEQRCGWSINSFDSNSL